MGCGISSDTGTDVLRNNVTQNGRASLLHPTAALDAAKEELADLNLDDPELEQAATKIQAAFRGHRTRQNVHKMAEEEQIDIDLNDPEVAEAATKIQASFRGHKVRKEMKTGGEKTGGEEELTEKMEELQTNKEDGKEGGDGGGGGPVAVEEEVDLDLNDPDLGKAAVKIQAQFRGQLARKSKPKESEPSQ